MITSQYLGSSSITNADFNAFSEAIRVDPGAGYLYVDRCDIHLQLDMSMLAYQDCRRAVALPQPTPQDGTWYRSFFAVIQWCGANFSLIFGRSLPGQDLALPGPGGEPRCYHVAIEPVPGARLRPDLCLTVMDVSERLALATWIVDCDGRFSLTRRFQLIRPADGKTLLKARTRFACVALSSGRPKRLPEEYQRIYGAAVVAE